MTLGRAFVPCRSRWGAGRRTKNKMPRSPFMTCWKPTRTSPGSGPEQPGTRRTYRLWRGSAGPTPYQRLASALLLGCSLREATRAKSPCRILRRSCRCGCMPSSGGCRVFGHASNPRCPEVPERFRGRRPVGRIYTDPRPWCSERCGCRVMELFSCRKCGLLFAGGIPDSGGGGLWPWSDDFGGEQRDLGDYRIFGVEQPHGDYQVQYRSTKSTLRCGPRDRHARPSFDVEPAMDWNDATIQVSPFPGQCPRCQNYRSPQGEREIVEPLRTRGPRSISVVMEDALRVQPDANAEQGAVRRKALVFSDSRQDAAQLAGDVKRDHQLDVFRQLLYQVLHQCPDCRGKGIVTDEAPYRIGRDTEVVELPCDTCGGAGRNLSPRTIPYKELRREVIDTQVALGIDPTDGHMPAAFERLGDNDSSVHEEAQVAFDLAARREISQEDFGLEPLGLAMWTIPLPGQTGSLEALSETETQMLLRTVARILATEKHLVAAAPTQALGMALRRQIAAV